VQIASTTSLSLCPGLHVSFYVNSPPMTNGLQYTNLWYISG